MTRVCVPARTAEASSSFSASLSTRCAVVVALLVSVSPVPAAGSPPLTIPYHLPVDLAQVEVSVGTIADGTVSRVLPNDAKGRARWEFSRAVSVERVGTLSLKTVADPSAARELRIPKASWSDVEASVELTEGGLLSGINVSTAGRGEDVLRSVAKFAGVVAGFWTGSAVHAVALGGSGSETFDVAPDPGTENPEPCLSADALAAAAVPVELQALVSLEPAACAAYLRMRRAAEKVDRMRIERDELAEQVLAASGAELTKFSNQLKIHRVEVTYAEQILEERRDALDLLYRRFAGERCLGRKVETGAARELLPLDRLPSAAALGWLAPGADLSRDAVRRALDTGGWTEAHRLFESTGALATLDDRPGPDGDGEVPDPDRGSRSAEIAWRQVVPVRLRIWTLAGASPLVHTNDKDACRPALGEDPAAGSSLTLASDTILDVAHPDSPVRTMSLEAKAFADRSLAIDFDARGRPRRIDTSGSGSAADLAGALAASAQGFRDEYDATLKKRVSIGESKRELALDGLSDRIAELESQKKELDARAALLGTAGNFDDLVARQRLDSDLKLLEAQVALRMAEATAEHRVAIAELEKRVLETQKRLDLLEVQQQLELAGRRR
jgi:hypothetical protein